MAIAANNHQALNAVLAHALLDRVTIIAGTAETLRDCWGALDGEERLRLLEMVAGHAVLLGSSIRQIDGLNL